MNIQTGIKFHNRFTIEVRDGNTGVLKEKGQAENIILNQIYNQLCNTSGYFHHIHFGRGTGTPNPERTTLFSRISSKSAETEEVIRAFPTSSWTRKIRLMPEEFVDETLTEVGIGFGSNANQLVTHAMIKDAEGNPLSLTKTAIDLVTIYATVYVTFMTDSTEIDFYKETNNRLMTYLTGASFSNPELDLGSYGEDTYYNNIGYYRGNFSLNRTNHVANRTITYSGRIGVDAHNFDIRELFLSDILRVNLKKSTIWDEHAISENIGVGDGESTTFDLPWYDLEDLTLKVDGQEVSDYSLAGLDWENKELHPLAKLVRDGVIVSPVPEITRGAFGNRSQRPPIGTFSFPVDPEKIVGTTFRFHMLGGWSFGAISVILHIAGSYDGETFVDEQTYEARGSTAQIFEHTVDEPYTHLRFRQTSSSDSSRVYYFMVLNPDPQSPKVTFHTPPLEGQVIQVQGKVPYIPKTNNYVLDVSFSIEFGEGV